MDFLWHPADTQPSCVPAALGLYGHSAAPRWPDLLAPAVTCAGCNVLEPENKESREKFSHNTPGPHWWKGGWPLLTLGLGRSWDSGQERRLLGISAAGEKQGSGRGLPCPPGDEERRGRSLSTHDPHRSSLGALIKICKHHKVQGRWPRYLLIEYKCIVRKVLH